MEKVLLSTVRGITLVVSRPLLLLPAMVLAAINLLLFGLAQTAILQFIDDVVFFGGIPATSFEELPFQLYSTYSAELNIIFLLFFFSVFSSIFLTFFYSKFLNDLVDKKASLAAKAFGFALANFGKIALLSVSVIAFLLILAIVSWICIIVAAKTGFFGIVLLILWLLFALYLAVKLFFAIPITALDNVNLKDGLKFSWSFSEKRFFSIIALIVLIGVFGAILSILGFAVADFAPEVQAGFDLLYFFVVLAFFALNSAYSSIVLLVYYLRKQHNKLP